MKLDNGAFRLQSDVALEVDSVSDPNAPHWRPSYAGFDPEVGDVGSGIRLTEGILDYRVHRHFGAINRVVPCTVSSDPWQDGEVRREGVTMWVHRFRSTQLYLGPSGKRLAEERYEHARHMMDTEGRSCAYKRHGADGSACALHSDRGFDLHAQRGNVYTHIIATTHEALPDDLLASLADEVLTRLDSGATGASYPQISRSGTLPRPHMLPGSGRIGTVRGSAAPREHGHDHPAA